MNTKICRKCKIEKEEKDFYLVRGKPSSYCKSCAINSTREWRIRYPKKIHAHSQVYRAIKLGKLIKAETCSSCGNRTYIIAHHPDYNYPLQVVWLCDPCHFKEHARLNRIKKEKRINAALISKEKRALKRLQALSEENQGNT